MFLCCVNVFCSVCSCEDIFVVCLYMVVCAVQHVVSEMCAICPLCWLRVFCLWIVRVVCVLFVIAIKVWLCLRGCVGGCYVCDVQRLAVCAWLCVLCVPPYMSCVISQMIFVCFVSNYVLFW